MTHSDVCKNCGIRRTVNDPPELCSKCGSRFARDLLSHSNREAPTISPHPPKTGSEDVTIDSQARREGANEVPLREFGDYELLREIARGGMGVVYEARQKSLNRIVAIKMILTGKLASTEDISRFITEAQAAANLHHPNIVSIHEVGEHEGQHFFSMELVDGHSLAEIMRQEQVTMDEAVRLLASVAEAIQCAHAHGTLHRDLKPSNILVDETGRPHVTDFGLAKQMDSDRGLTNTGQALGTPSYMSPEQAAGNWETIGPATDIYALGAILYELLTGKPPFRADTPVDTILQVLEQDPRLPRELNPKVPRDLETICLICLAKDPGKRYSTVQELRDELIRYLNGEPIRRKKIGTIRRISYWCRNRPALMVTWSALCVFYLVHLIAMFVLKLPGEGGTFHGFVTGLVVCWGLGAWLFQHLISVRKLEVIVPYGWSAMDIVLFTLFLLAAKGPSSPVVIGFLLLVASSALRFHIPLVWFTCILSASGYVSLLIDAILYREEVRTPLHTPFYFLMSLLIMAAIMHLLLRRVRVGTSGQPGSISLSATKRTKSTAATRSMPS